MSDLDARHFHNEKAARRHLEATRWPDGPICPHCGTVGDAYKTSKEGVYRCGSKECRKDFSVTVGTIFERSHIPLHKWLLAFRLICGSKKGFSAHQLHRTLGVTYKTAWFMAHRIRESMKDTNPGPLGGEGKVIEADETFTGPKTYTFSARRDKWVAATGHGRKYKIMTLVERGGKARSIKVDDLTIPTVRKVLVTNADRKSRLMTDGGRHYIQVGAEFAKHETVNHEIGEYARDDVTTNTVEGFFSIFKRGMRGVYQHCSEAHLHRYLAEFDFRYNERAALGVDDALRTLRAIKGAEGKRLMYRQPDQAGHA